MNYKSVSFIFILSLFTGCSEETFEEKKNNISEYLENGEATKSLITAKNLLRETIESNDESATFQTRILLARSYLALGDYENALRFYSILEEPAPIEINNSDWHRALFLAFELDQPQFAEHILNQLKPRLNSFEVQIYNDRVDNQKLPLSLPDSVQVHRFAKLQQGHLTAKNNIVLANQIFQQLIEEYPNFAEVYLFKARANHELNNYQIALDSYIAFEKLKPIQPAAKLQIAAIAMQIGQPEVARPYIETLAKMAPESPIILQLQGVLALHDNNFKEAKLHSEQSIGFGLDSHINRLIAGMSSFRLKQWEQANTHLRWISQDLEANHPARRMLIASKLALKEPELALQLLSELNLNINDIALTTELAKQLIKKGYLDKAKQVQDRASKLHHFNDAIRIQHHQLDLSIQKQAVKEQLIANVADAKADDQEKVNLVLLHLADGEFNNAHAIANRWYVSAPKNINAINSLATVEMAIGSKRKGARLLAEALKVEPQNLPSLLFNLQTLKEQEDWKALENQSQNLLNTLPYTNKNLFSYWLEALNKQSKLDLDIIAPRLNYNSDYELVFISGLFRKQQFDKLNDYLYTRVEQKSWQEIHWLMAIELSTREQKKLQSELLIAQYLTSDRALSLEQVNFVVKHAMAFKNHQLVIKIVTDTMDTIGDSVSTLVPHIVSLIALEKITQAQALLSQFTLETPEYLEAQFELHQELGDMEKAWTALEKSTIGNPTLVKFSKLKSIANSPEQMATIKSLLAELAPVSVDEILIRATASQWFISIDAHFAFYMLDTPRLEPLLKENFILANNFAWLLNERGEIERAKKFAQIALDAAPDNEQVIDTYNKVFGK